MKRIIITSVLVTIFLISCSDKKSTEDFSKKNEPTIENSTDPLEQGQQIFEGKGTCMACHQPDKKIIGPSLKEISKIYTDKNASIVTFLKGESEPIVDPAQFEVMKANFTITKNMTEEELQLLETYIFSFK